MKMKVVHCVIRGIALWYKKSEVLLQEPRDASFLKAPILRFYLKWRGILFQFSAALRVNLFWAKVRSKFGIKIFLFLLSWHMIPAKCFGSILFLNLKTFKIE